MKKLVSIDGPSASGKSTVSRMLSKELGWPWVSTGAFYRGLAYAVLTKNIPLDNEDEILGMTTSKNWRVLMTLEKTQVFYKDKEVTDDIAGEKVGAIASRVSQIAPVRAALLGRQRNCFDPEKGLIAEGRDCGTVVFPTSPVKIFLTANAEQRAQRRSTEEKQDQKKILEMQRKRDQNDSQRSSAPLKAAEDAVIIDSSNMELKAVVEQIQQLILAKRT